MPRQLELGAFMRPISIHTGAWRYPGAFPDANFNLAHIKRFAQTLERGRFDAFFMADHLAVLNMPISALRRSHTVTSFEPFTLLSYLAAATERIGLVATASTTFDAPYHIARRFASLDHISGGRAGWNVVTTSNPDAALNFGLDEHVEHDERYRRAREFYDVVTGLWDSFADDAFVRDVNEGIYFDPSKLHVLGRMEKLGRSRDHLEILPGAFVVIGDSEAEAREKRERLDSLVHDDSSIASLSIILGHDASGFDPDAPLPEIPPSNASHTGRERAIELARRENLTVRQLAHRFGGFAGLSFVGTPASIADQMETWLLEEGADGFNILFSYLPQGLDDFVEKLVPELQRRGIFRREYTGQRCARTSGCRVRTIVFFLRSRLPLLSREISRSGDHSWPNPSIGSPIASSPPRDPGTAQLSGIHGRAPGDIRSVAVVRRTRRRPPCRTTPRAHRECAPAGVVADARSNGFRLLSHASRLH